MEIGQIVNKLFGFVCRKLIFVLLRIRLHIAVHALEIAGFRGVPDHHRPHAFGRPISHRVGIFRIAQIIPIIFPRE